jgi:spore germination protein YaaH
LEQKVPADKIDLGQAGYGYIWRPKGAHAVSDAKARALVAKDGATAHFDNKVGEWVAYLSDGSTMWWADARSMAMRMAFVRGAGIHGIAVWDLGQSDPITQ